MYVEKISREWKEFTFCYICSMVEFYLFSALFRSQDIYMTLHFQSFLPSVRILFFGRLFRCRFNWEPRAFIWVVFIRMFYCYKNVGLTLGFTLVGLLTGLNSISCWKGSQNLKPRYRNFCWTMNQIQSCPNLWVRNWFDCWNRWCSHLYSRWCYCILQ